MSERADWSRSIDRASVVAAAILHAVRVRGTGTEAGAEIRAILRDEFSDVARTTLNEIRESE